MINPMMVLTTSISTSVKPASPPRSAAPALRPVRALLMPSSFPQSLPASSTDKLAHRNERRHHRYDQATDNDTNNDNSSRTGNSNQPVQRALQLGLIELGHSTGQNRQLPGFIAQPQHAHRHWRKNVHLGKGIGQFCAVSHPVDHLFPDVSRSRRRHDIDEDAQRRRQMHPAA